MSARGSKGGKWLSVLVFVVIVAAVYTAWASLRPLPALQPVLKPLTTVGTTSTLNWPAGLEAAVGVNGTAILDTNLPQKPLPTASTAKVITALTVLSVKPLAAGQSGPVITLGPNDVNLYNSYKAAGGSVVPVVSGEQITEYQVLEAMMIPSANNLADSLAIWAYGSLPNYQTAATDFAKEHGLTGTTIGSDASGFSPSTVSTARDLVKAGQLAMKNPVLAGIVSKQSTSDIPLAGAVKNVNFLLGVHGIIGVKTGNTDQAGGVYISASSAGPGKPQIITGLIGASTLWQSMQSSLPLIVSAQNNIKPVKVLPVAYVVGIYNVPWATSVQARTAADLTVLNWQGTKIKPVPLLQDASAGSAAGTVVGSEFVSNDLTGKKVSVQVKLAAPIPKPPLSWRLKHPW